MGTVPTSPSFVAGEKLTAAKLNQFRDAIGFLQNPPRCTAYQSTSQTLTSGATPAITLDAEVYDIVQSGDTPAHDLTTDPSRIYIRTPGKYELSGQVLFGVNATGGRTVSIRKNAAGVSAGGSLLIVSNGTALTGVATAIPIPVIEAQFSAGDYVELFASQNSGANVDTSVSGSSTFLRVKFVGA